MSDYWIQALVSAPAVLLVLYVTVRVVAAAWYKSKRQFDNQPKG